MENYTPTKARQYLYQILKAINKQKKPITITPVNGNEGQVAIIIAKKILTCSVINPLQSI